MTYSAIRMPLKDSDSCYTPQWILDMLPPITLDPCWSPESLVDPVVALDIRDGTDGLSVNWGFCRSVGTFVFMNPPFSNTGAWLAKARQESSTHKLTVCALIPALPGDGPWHKNIWGAAKYVGFFSKRIQFLLTGGSYKQKGRGHALVLYGSAEACADTLRTIICKDTEHRLFWVNALTACLPDNKTLHRNTEHR